MNVKIKKINELLEQCDSFTVDAVYIAIYNICNKPPVSRKSRIRRFIWR